MKICLLGKPTSGKGTIAGMLAKDFKIPTYSAGDLLRTEALKSNSAIGRKIKEALDTGGLVTAEIIADIIRKTISEKKGYILDGYPRSMEQVKIFDPEFDTAIYLACSDEMLFQRSAGRLSCIKCNAVFNAVTNKPKIAGLCDFCRGKLAKRDDDVVDGRLKKRLEVYYNETEPVVEHYRKKGILTEIDGEKSIKQVYTDIKKVLNE